MTETPESDGMTADPRMLELLICPVTRKPLEYDRAAQELISKSAGLAYPIHDGLPILLEEAARPLDDEPGA